MEIIQNNPFRILGLPVTASDREIAKRVNDLSTFCEFGKEKHYDVDFLFISDFERTTESVERAASQIELPEQKLLYSNFWFWHGNSIDDLVFEVLKDGNVDKALTLWQHPIKRDELSSKHLSNYKNFALLNLIVSLQSENINTEKLQQSVNHFVSIFSHPSYIEFISTITGKTHTATATQAQQSFADELYKNIFQKSDTNHGISSKEFLNFFKSTNREVIQFVSSKFVNEPIHRIEKSIELNTISRKNDPDLAYINAKEMLATSQPDVDFLKNLLPQEDVQLQTILDKLAEELLSCSTAFYNATYKEDRKVAIQRSRGLTNLANSLGCSHATKQRIREDLTQIAKLEKSESISKYIDEIMEQLDALPNSDSISKSQLQSMPLSLNRLLSRTSTPLSALKNAGPEGLENYKGFSNLIVQVCVGCCVHYANKSDDFESILKILAKLKNMPMEPDVRAHYLTNLKIITQNVVVQSANKRTAASSSGCYVATLVYGGYNTPEVIVLRHFRDTILMQCAAGRWLVKSYYLISPYLVKTLRNHERIQQIIRTALDKLVTRLK